MRAGHAAGPARCLVVPPARAEPGGRIDRPRWRRLSAQWNDGAMAGNVSHPGRHGHQPGAGAGRRVRRGAPSADAVRAGRAGRNCPVPTAHRLVGELVAWGALSRTTSGEYVVGRRLWDVGLLAPVQTGLRQLASPYLHDLYGATLATVHLAVRDGTQVLYLDRLSGHASVPVVSTIGSRLPMHATGVGKVLLAHAPPAVQAEVLAHLTRITPYTDQPAGHPAPTAGPGAPGRLRHDGGGDEPRRVLGGRADPRAGATWSPSLGIVLPSLKKDRAKLVTAMQVAARSIGRALVDPVRPPWIASTDRKARWRRHQRATGILRAMPPRPTRTHRRHRRWRTRRPDAVPPARRWPASTRVVVDLRTRQEIEQTHRAGILEQDSVRLLVDTGVSDRVLRDGYRHEGIELGLRRASAPHRLRGAGRRLGPALPADRRVHRPRRRPRARRRRRAVRRQRRRGRRRDQRQPGHPVHRRRRQRARGPLRLPRRRRRLPQHLPRRPSRSRMRRQYFRGVPVRLVRHPVRGAAERARADLQPLRARLRADQPAHRDPAADVLPVRPRRGRRRLVRRPHLGGAAGPGRRQRLHPEGGPDHVAGRCCRSAASSRSRCATATCCSPATPPTPCRRPAPRGSTSRWPTCGCSPRSSSGRSTKKDGSLLDAYTPRALDRVWKAQHFSYWMTTMLHRAAGRQPVRRTPPDRRAVHGGRLDAPARPTWPRPTPAGRPDCARPSRGACWGRGHVRGGARGGAPQGGCSRDAVTSRSCAGCCTRSSAGSRTPASASTATPTCESNTGGANRWARPGALRRRRGRARRGPPCCGARCSTRSTAATASRSCGCR